MLNRFYIILFAFMTFFFTETAPLFPTDNVVLTGIGRPVNLAIDDSQLYILENHKVHIYGLKDFKKISSFGKKGQGPGEFHTLPHVHITLDCSSNELIVGSIRKISYFSKKGKLLRETRGNSQAMRLLYLGKQKTKPTFLGWSQKVYEKFNYNTINLFDEQLNKIKELYRAKDPYQGPGKGYKVLTKAFNFTADPVLILIPGANRDSVDVLNRQFKKQFSITPDIPLRKVSGSFKKEMIHYLKTSPETKNAYPLIRPIRFPTYFPKVSDFFIDSGKIYILTWNRSKKGNLFFVYNIKGEFLYRKVIPIRYETLIQSYPLTIKKGKLYQLVENETEGEWELLITAL